MQLEVTPLLRPCYVNGKKAMFHRWNDRRDIIAPSMAVGGHNGGELQYVTALVEFEDGSVNEVSPHKVRFADGGEFKNIVFLPEIGGTVI